VDHASARNLILELCKEANKEVVFLIDQDTTIENLRFRGKTFEESLRVLLLKNGGDFSVSNGIYYIIDAQKKDIQNRFLTNILVPLQWISVTDLQRLLPPNLSASGKIKLDERDTRVLLNGTAEELRPILDFIALIDTPSGNEKIVRIDLSFLRTDEIFPLLPPEYSSFSPIPLPTRTGFVISMPEKKLEGLKEFISLVDKPSIYVRSRIDLSYFKTDEVIPLLPPEYQTFGPIPLPTRTGFVIGMPEEKMQQLRDFIALIDKQDQSLPITLNYIKVDELLAALPPSAAERNIKKSPDPRLVFYIGPEASRRAFLRDLASIDRPKPQVKYQILILSVADTDNNTWQPGLTLTASTASPGAVLQKGVLEGLLSLGFDVIASFGIDFALNLQWKILHNKANVVADTVLAALSGEKITFKNTTTVRVKDTEVVSSTTTTTTQIIREISSGLMLTIEGWVSGNRMITMKIDSTLSDNVSSESDTDLPKTTEKVFATTVRTQVGKPLAVTGLKQRQLVENVAKMPLLGDIPYIGKAFRTKTKSFTDTQYSIYIIPRLEMPEVNREAQERSLVEEYYRYLFAQDSAGPR
jgi:type II secretory pathway component GspD/PulD (secretin)